MCSRGKFEVQWIQNVEHVERELEGSRSRKWRERDGQWFNWLGAVLVE